jgi:hypothetical protein
MEKKASSPLPEKELPTTDTKLPYLADKKLQALVLFLLLILVPISVFFARKVLRKNSAPQPVSIIQPTIMPTEPSPTLLPTSRTIFSMIFILNTDINTICDYPVIGLGGRNLGKLTADGSLNFDPVYLEQAQSCGTKVIVALNDKTERILNDNGQDLDLQKYEDIIALYAGKIDEYVNDGTIIAHGVIDEPHDCNNDWGGVCPTAEEVDQASRISKQYWPTLPTAVNTVPQYLRSENYTWVHTDIINFQYAFHKYQGNYQQFISDAAALHDSGMFREISWALQAKSGGCLTYQECSMSPQQIVDVGGAMCNTGKGEWINFVYYDTSLLTDEMDTAIAQLSTICAR